MKKTIMFTAVAGAFVIAGLLGTPTTAKAEYCDQSSNGCAHALTKVGKCDGYDGTATTTGSGAGGFGYQSGQGNNQAGGKQGQPNYNPLICGNPNDNALVRGPN